MSISYGEVLKSMNEWDVIIAYKNGKSKTLKNRFGNKEPLSFEERCKILIKCLIGSTIPLFDEAILVELNELLKKYRIGDNMDETNKEGKS